MRNIFKKALAGTTAIALAATLFVGVDGVKADTVSEGVTLQPWTFVQSGTTTAGANGYNAWEQCYFTNVNFTTGDVLTEKDFPKGEIRADWGGVSTDCGKDPLTVNTKVVADGFDATMGSNGWSADYDNNANNPWTLRAEMHNISVTPGHKYTISFDFGWNGTSDDGRLSKGLKTVISNNYGEGMTYTEGSSDMEVYVNSGNTAKVTYNFTSYAENATLDVALMMGAFPFAPTAEQKETGAKGTVSIKNFTITDNGLEDGYDPGPEIPTAAPTEKPTIKPTTPVVQPTTKPSTNAKKTLAKVKGLKAVNKKKGTVKLSWKKVSKAKKYQIKVGKKTYTAKKNTLTVKKLKKGKKYTFKVRAIASGYKSGAWVKKSIKIKK